MDGRDDANHDLHCIGVMAYSLLSSGALAGHQLRGRERRLDYCWRTAWRHHGPPMSHGADPVSACCASGNPHRGAFARLLIPGNRAALNVDRPEVDHASQICVISWVLLVVIAGALTFKATVLFACVGCRLARVPPAPGGGGGGGHNLIARRVANSIHFPMLSVDGSRSSARAFRLPKPWESSRRSCQARSASSFAACRTR